MRIALTGTAILAYISLATSHVIKRDISIVLRGLSTLNANIGTFGASVYRYDGTLPAAIEIFHQESSLEKDLEGVTADTNSTAEWTAQESNSVTESLVGLEPIMRTSIAALVMKRDLFISAGVGSAVRLNLVNMRSRTVALSVALQNKAVGADKETIRQGTGDVDDAYDSAIDSYESRL
ncbi:hypothetical protein ASPFODRAFT_132894 [Aspergillus luchuensis CBS 106.47]|uniref:Uncharacterized protein n=1 Tax=Aspergillus luchuensis (strain CBS 106.47) TaxID=1137211 RepID=A0A1M3TM26_ASPLC|nr:hypothetical protein ASPFODRAFT_132894 [Aspergillus luchuensis CBS 106.47]